MWFVAAWHHQYSVRSRAGAHRWNSKPKSSKDCVSAANLWAAFASAWRVSVSCLNIVDAACADFLWEHNSSTSGFRNTQTSAGTGISSTEDGVPVGVVRSEVAIADEDFRVSAAPIPDSVKLRSIVVRRLR